MSAHLTRYFHSPFPALFFPCCQEYVATNIIYVDTPDVDCRNTEAQFYCGIDS